MDHILNEALLIAHGAKMSAIFFAIFCDEKRATLPYSAKQAQQPIENRDGMRGTTRYIEVHGYQFIRPALHIQVADEWAAGYGTGPDAITIFGEGIAAYVFSSASAILFETEPVTGIPSACLGEATN